MDPFETLSKAVMAACAVLAFSLASPSEARRIVVDQSEFVGGTPLANFTPCSVGSPCTALTLPFSFDFGSGLTDQFYVYDSGILSFGSAIPLGVDPLTSDFTTFGVPVIAPLYQPGASYITQVINSPVLGLSPTLPLPANTVAIVYDEFGDNQVVLLLGGASDQITFEFLHGYSINPNEFFIPNTVGASLGFALGGGTEIALNPDVSGTFAYNLQAEAAVPEPSTWAMLLLGFAAVGGAMRAARRASAKQRASQPFSSRMSRLKAA